MRPRPLFADWAFVVGGAALLFATLHLYSTYRSPSGRVTSKHISSQEAERTIRSILSHLNSNPEDFNAYAQLAIAYCQKGPENYAEGLNALDRARTLGATSVALFYYAGVMYSGLGLTDYAVNELTKYLRHYPDDYETQVRLANLYLQQKKYDEAYPFYRQAVHRWRKDPTIWFNYALASKEKQSWDEALAALKKVKEIAGQLPEGGLFQEGEIWRLKGSDDAAKPLYEQEIALHPEYLPALDALESLLRRKGLVKEARELRKRIWPLKHPAAPAAVPVSVSTSPAQ